MKRNKFRLSDGAGVKAPFSWITQPVFFLKRATFVLLSFLVIQSVCAVEFTQESLSYSTTIHEAQYSTGENVVRVDRLSTYPTTLSGSIVIPDEVTYDGVTYKVIEIGTDCFLDCEKITSVTLGSNIRHICINGFYGCSNLTTVTCNALTPPSIYYPLTDRNGYHTFSNIANADLYVPAASIQAYYDDTEWNQFKTITSPGSTFLVTGIYLNVQNGTLQLGETVTIEPTCYPVYATNKSVSWSSNATDVATVSSSGLVTAVGIGEATITCSAADGSGITSQSHITVTPIKVSSVSLDKTQITIGVGQSSALVASILPDNAADKSVTWTSSDEDVATVDESGNITAISTGDATITVTANDGSNKKATCKVSVSDATWTLTDGTLTIDGTGPMASYGVGDAPWYDDRESIYEVDIKEGITTISDNAFNGCNMLTTVNIPSSVTKVGSNTFKDCGNLMAVTCKATTPPTTQADTWGDGLVSTAVLFVTEKSVYEQSSWNVFTKIETLEDFVNTVYKDYPNLLIFNDYKVTLPTTYIKHTFLKGDLFKGTAKLSTSGHSFTVYVNEEQVWCFDATATNKKSDFSVTISEDNSIVSCLSSSKLQTDVAIVRSDYYLHCTAGDGVATIFDASYFEGVRLPQSCHVKNTNYQRGVSSENDGIITTIGDNAFLSNNFITELRIPANIKTIGVNALNSSSIQSLYFESAVPPTLSDANSVPSNCLIFVPANSVELYKTAENWSSHSAQIRPATTKTSYDVTVEANDNMSVLHALIGEENLINVQKLTIHGTINSYDIMIMRNKMINLKDLDLSNATIVANSYCYVGTTCSKDNIITPNAIPTQLDNIVLPQNITAIEANGVNGVSNLKSLEIPGSVKTLYTNSIYNCTNLKSLAIKEGITTLPKQVINSCSALTRIIIPNSVTTIKQPIIGSPASVFDYFETPSFNSYETTGSKQMQIHKLVVHKSISLPDNYTTIDTLKIGNEMTGIPDKLMQSCSKTFKVLYIGSGIKSIGNYAFYCNISSTIIERCPTDKVYIESINQWCNISFGNAYSNPLSSTNKLYLNDSPVTEVTIPSTNTKVNNYNFANCTTLKKVIIPANVKTIGNDAFNGCTALETVVIEEGVETISSNAFKGCTKLNNVVLPASLKTISTSAFEGCTSLNTITWGSGLASIAATAFKGCTKLQNFEASSCMTTIGANAFEGCTAMTTATLSNTVTSMGTYAFKGCTGLLTVTIPVDATLTAIPNYAFTGCTKLQSVNLPTSIKTIGSYAFQNCTSMAEVRIPSSITSIGSYAFTGCTALNDVYTYTIEPQTIDDNTFATYTTATLHVPAVSRYTYYYDTQWSKFLTVVNFDEPYTYVYIAKDFDIYTETAGTISGKPRLDIGAGGGVTVTGSINQELADIHINYDVTTGKGASLIGNNNLTADNLYIDIDVKSEYWHFFCFPFDVDLTKIKKDGSYVFRRFDSALRAENGTGSWQNVTGTVLEAGKGYIFRTNTAGTLSIPVANPDLTAKDEATELGTYGTSETSNADRNWNFTGNRYLAYFDINDLAYTAPVIVWNGTTYVAYRPGDDDYTLSPFQAFFLQKPTKVTSLNFDMNGRTTYLKTQSSQASQIKSRREKAAKLNKSRQLINISLRRDSLADNTRIVFNDEQSLEYEMECDASKFISKNAVPQLYSLDAHDTKYAINERPRLDGKIELGFIADAAGEYTLAATRMDVPVYVTDNYTGETFCLSEEYTFTSESGEFNDRFSVSLTNTNATAIQSVSLSQIDSNAEIYDLNGRKANKGQKGVLIVNGQKVYVK